MVVLLVADDDVLDTARVVILVAQPRADTPAVPLPGDGIIGRSPIVVAVNLLRVVVLGRLAVVARVSPFQAGLVLPAEGGKVISCRRRGDVIVVGIVYRLVPLIILIDNLLVVGLPRGGIVGDDQQLGIIAGLPRVTGRETVVHRAQFHCVVIIGADHVVRVAAGAPELPRHLQVKPRRAVAAIVLQAQHTSRCQGIVDAGKHAVVVTVAYIVDGVVLVAVVDVGVLRVGTAGIVMVVTHRDVTR